MVRVDYLTRVVTEALLLVVLLSCVVEVIWARLVNVPRADVLATIFTVALVPLIKLPRLQVTVAAPEHVPLVVVAETKDKPLGSASVRMTLSAFPGPLLPTLQV